MTYLINQILTYYWIVSDQEIVMTPNIEGGKKAVLLLPGTFTHTKLLSQRESASI